ncbi:hypothetical protein DOY81_005582 [Sarcophaga bullata]|nr:hypothetical protein DOY81_005582 [Sarcophaga bullata]
MALKANNAASLGSTDAAGRIGSGHHHQVPSTSTIINLHTNTTYSAKNSKMKKNSMLIQVFN